MHITRTKKKKGDNLTYVFKLGLSLLTHLRRQDFPVRGNKPLDRMELQSLGPYLSTCFNSTSSSSLLHGPFFMYVLSNSLSICTWNFQDLLNNWIFFSSEKVLRLFMVPENFWNGSCTCWLCSCTVRFMGTTCACARDGNWYDRVEQKIDSLNLIFQ